MDNVHKKRLETMRRRKEEAGLLGTPGATQSSGTTGSVKNTHKIPGTAKGFVPTPTQHVRKRSLVSEQLARFLNDTPASATSADRLNGGKSDLKPRPNSAAPDREPPNARAPKRRNVVLDSEWEEDSSLLNGLDSDELADPQNPKDELETGETPEELPQAIERTASGRGYGEFKGTFAQLEVDATL